MLGASFIIFSLVTSEVFTANIIKAMRLTTAMAMPSFTSRAKAKSFVTAEEIFSSEKNV